MTKLIVSLLSKKKETEWDSFVKNCGKGTFFHTLKWKRILENSFPFEPTYLIVEDEQKNMVGVCPFVILKRFWSFTAFHSLPNSDFGGPLTRDQYNRSVVSHLIACLKELSSKKGVTYAVIRCSDEETYRALAPYALMVNRSYGTMELDLEEKPVDLIWNNVFSKKNKQRKYIRRFIRDGFQNREAENRKDLNKFFVLYHNNMNYIGASPYPLSFFNNIYNLAYPDNFNIILTEDRKKCIGGLAFFIYKDTVYLAFLGLDRDIPTSYHTSYYLYWGATEWAQKNGFRYVNFGGTPSNKKSQYFQLKKKFGAEFKQRYLMYIPLNQKLMSRNILEAIKKLRNVLPECLKQPLSKVLAPR